MGRMGRREFFRRMARRLGLTLEEKKRGKGSLVGLYREAQCGREGGRSARLATDQRCWSGSDDEKRRWRAARADGMAAWQGGERPAQFGEAAARTLGRHVAWFRAAQGGRCSAHGRRSSGGASGREKSEQSRAEGLEVDKRTDSKFSKNTGTPL
jgi:hypothetical protein